MIISLTTTAQATIWERWKIQVPDGLDLESVDMLELLEGEHGARVLDVDNEASDNESDRQVENYTIEEEGQAQ